MNTIVCVFAAPIPVGHRVELQWFAVSAKGLLGGTSSHSFNHEPILRDLETGVEYSSERAFERGRMKVPDQPIPIGDRLGEGVEISHRMVGRVVRCRVVTLRGYSDYDVQTHLDLEPAHA